MPKALQDVVMDSTLMMDMVMSTAVPCKKVERTCADRCLMLEVNPNPVLASSSSHRIEAVDAMRMTPATSDAMRMHYRHRHRDLATGVDGEGSGDRGWRWRRRRRRRRRRLLTLLCPK
jgi:hypothetical protein